MIGLLLNVSMLFVAFRIPKIRNPTTFYLCNLAVSDSALLISTGTGFLQTLHYSPQINFGFKHRATSTGCFTDLMAHLSFYFASVFFVCLVTFDRYLAICHPMKHRLIKGKRFTGTTTTGVWIVSVLVPLLVVPRQSVIYLCINWPNDGKYSNMPSRVPSCIHLSPVVYFGITLMPFVDLCHFMIAVLLCVYMFVRIIYTLSTRPNLNEASLRARNQIARMLILNGTVFFICLFPFQLIVIEDIHIAFTGEPFLDVYTSRAIAFCWTINNAIKFDS